MENVFVFVAGMDKIFFCVFIVSFIMLLVTTLIYSYQPGEIFDSGTIGIGFDFLEGCMAGWIAIVTLFWTLYLITKLINFLLYLMWRFYPLRSSLFFNRGFFYLNLLFKKLKYYLF